MEGDAFPQVESPDEAVIGDAPTGCQRRHDLVGGQVELNQRVVHVGDDVAVVGGAEAVGVQTGRIGWLGDDQGAAVQRHLLFCRHGGLFQLLLGHGSGLFGLGCHRLGLGRLLLGLGQSCLCRCVSFCGGRLGRLQIGHGFLQGGLGLCCLGLGCVCYRSGGVRFCLGLGCFGLRRRPGCGLRVCCRGVLSAGCRYQSQDGQ